MGWFLDFGMEFVAPGTWFLADGSDSCLHCQLNSFWEFWKGILKKRPQTVIQRLLLRRKMTRLFWIPDFNVSVKISVQTSFVAADPFICVCSLRTTFSHSCFSFLLGSLCCPEQRSSQRLTSGFLERFHASFRLYFSKRQSWRSLDVYTFGVTVIGGGR